MASRAGQLRRAGLLASRPLAIEQNARLRAVLSEEDSFAKQGMRCFIPGLGFTIGRGPDAVEILVCLRCHWAYFFHGDSLMTKALSDAGRDRLATLYREVFPDGDPELA